jgi:predicted 2-oxoglutarate/Fe(II)-dependent dioxygenase YbiX
MHYKIQKLITNDERHALIDLYNSIPSNIAEQDYNLANVDKRRLGSTHGIEPVKKIDQYAKENGNLKCLQHYFVMYKKGAFTRLHTDDDEKVKLTVVTLVDTADLVGGETVSLLPWSANDNKSVGYKKGNDVEDESRVIPMVIKPEVGESMMYDRAFLHGVAKVESGLRLVLVSWYCEST